MSLATVEVSLVTAAVSLATVEVSLVTAAVSEPTRAVAPASVVGAPETAAAAEVSAAVAEVRAALARCRVEARVVSVVVGRAPTSSPRAASRLPMLGSDRLVIFRVFPATASVVVLEVVTTDPDMLIGRPRTLTSPRLVAPALACGPAAVEVALAVTVGEVTEASPGIAALCPPTRRLPWAGVTVVAPTAVLPTSAGTRLTRLRVPATVEVAADRSRADRVCPASASSTRSRVEVAPPLTGGLAPVARAGAAVRAAPPSASRAAVAARGRDARMASPRGCDRSGLSRG